MTLALDRQHADLETLTAVIAHSEIFVAQIAARLRFAWLAQSRPVPAGFDETDIAVLDWIAAEGRRAGRSFVRM
jgi:hypothetical protein